MVDTPVWALALIYWLHMLATVLWLGSLAALSLLVLPALHKVDTKAQAVLLAAIQKRLDPLGWFSIAMLLVTGLFQMSANPAYEGFLTIRGQWGTSILVKHIFFGLMILVSAAQTWGLLPSIQRAILRQQKSGHTAELAVLRKRERLLLNINLILAILILGMTALARAA
ncbi:MAG: CopD family protein [Anaerolineales bacterium]|nr:CopD family protein [Anaerolineales bacterium]